MAMGRADGGGGRSEWNPRAWRHGGAPSAAFGGPPSLASTLRKTSGDLRRASACGLVLATILLASPAGAATILVDSMAMTIDAGTCTDAFNDVEIADLPGGDGFTTLPEAICAANGTPGADTIVLEDRTYTIAAPHNYWYGPTGLPAISSEITIEGNGAVIGRDAAAPKLRLFYVAGSLHPVLLGAPPPTGTALALSPGNLTLRDLTLRGGLARGGDGGGGGGAGLGGAIYNQGALLLDGVTATGNEARGGNGLLRGGGGGLGGDGSLLTGHGGGFKADVVPQVGFFLGGEGGSISGAGGVSALGGDGGDGSDVAPLAGGGGGGFVADGDDGNAGGSGGDGGGDAGSAPGNRGGGAFGGGGAAGQVTICGSAGGVGGGGGSCNGSGPGGGFGGGGGGRGPGGFGGGGGGGYLDFAGGLGGFGGGGGAAASGGAFGGNGGATGAGEFAEREGAGGGAGLGGVVFNHFGTLTLRNATLAGNAARGGVGGGAAVVDDFGGGGGAGLGGAIFNLNGTVTVESSTLAGNTVEGGAGGGVSGQDGQGAGASIFNHFQDDGVGNSVPAVTTTAAATSVSIEDSILADGTADPATPAVPDTFDAGNDCFRTAGTTVTLLGANLIESNATGANACGSPTATADPGLAALAENGGPTETMAIGAASPAFDAATSCPAPSADQRGLSRPQWTACDLGAFELTESTVDRDFGDAADPTFPTLLAGDGARHVLSSLFLGACVDAEADGQPAASADGDDLGAGSLAMGTCAVAGDDEDGVVFTSGLVAGGTATVGVTASAAGLLDAWVDFDADGAWQPGEQVFTSEALAAGVNSLSFPVPGAATVGPTFARFRLSTAGGLAPGGFAADGEVEDDALAIAPPIAISIDDVALAEGDAGPTAFDFTVSVSSTAIAVEVTATVTGGTATAPEDFAAVAPTVLTFAQGGPLTQTFSVAVAGDLRVEAEESFAVTLSSPSAGAFLLDASGLGTILNDDTATVTLAPVAASGPEGDAGTSPRTFQVTLDAAVQGGFSVAYTTSDGTATTAGGDYVDDDGVLAFAGNVGESHGITVAVVGDTVVEADETFTVALGAISGLASGIAPAAVTVAGTPAEGTILDDDTGVFGATLEARKTVSGTPLLGATLLYTIELTNLGPGPQADNPGDELVDVLPPQVALVGASADLGVAVAELATHTVTWNGALAAGETATIAITVEVLRSALGTLVANQAVLAFDADNDGVNEGAAVSDDPGAGGNDDPTTFLGVSIAEIPTLGTWGALLLALAIGLLGLRACGRALSP
jgi:hypothetical protein